MVRLNYCKQGSGENLTNLTGGAAPAAEVLLLQYVRLALLKGEKVTRADKNLEEITRLTLQGQVDELLLRTEPLGDLRDIFHYENKPCPRLILIMGGPGEY